MYLNTGMLDCCQPRWLQGALLTLPGMLMGQLRPLVSRSGRVVQVCCVVCCCAVSGCVPQQRGHLQIYSLALGVRLHVCVCVTR